MSTKPIAEALANPRPAPRLAEVGDTRHQVKEDERTPFPVDAPCKPLGINSDISGKQCCYYLNYNGQLVGLEANNRHGKLGLRALVGPGDWLEVNWPRYSAPVYEGRGKDRVCVREAQIVGFDQGEAADAFVAECTRKGVFDPAGRMRGRGAHKIDGGGLVLHCGDRLRVSVPRVAGGVKGWAWREIGLHDDGNVYPAAAPIPRPWHEVCNARPAEQLLGVLQTWNWRRPLLDPRFVLGGIGASMVGGALPWRSHIWITGGSGTGKSTLNGQGEILHQLFGEGMFRSGNATSAAIRQTLKNSTVPVMMDEIETSKDNRKITEVIEMARVSSSGDKVHRGGQDHAAHEFTLQSLFWFSSVLVPELEPQDRNRLAILELKPLPDDIKPLPKLNYAEIGRKLQRRMCDAWAWLEDVAAVYRVALSAAGHDARGCTQFGWLLACADALIEDWEGQDWRPDSEHVLHWASICAPSKMREISEATPDHVACVQQLVTSMQQARGGDERVALGSWIGQVVAGAAPEVTDSGPGDRADARLQQMGLKIVNARRGKAGAWGATKFDVREPGFLAVASGHQGLTTVFASTKWQGGVHKQSLSRCPGAIDGVKMRFAYLNLRAVLVPLCNILDDDELPAASKPAAFDAWLSAQGGNDQGAEA